MRAADKGDQNRVDLSCCSIHLASHRRTGHQNVTASSWVYVTSTGRITSTLTITSTQVSLCQPTHSRHSFYTSHVLSLTRPSGAHSNHNNRSLYSHRDPASSRRPRNQEARRRQHGSIDLNEEHHRVGRQLLHPHPG